MPAHLAQIVQPKIDGGEASLLAHLNAEGIGLMGSDRSPDRRDDIADGALDRTDTLPDKIDQRRRATDDITERAGDELDRARAARRSPRRHGSAAHLIGFLEDDLANVHRGNAVDHRLVRLAQ